MKIENIIKENVKGGACNECGGTDLNHAAIILSFYSPRNRNFKLVPYFVINHFQTKHPEIYSAIKYLILFHAYSQ